MTATTTAPLTLAQIAAELDQHRSAIAAITADRDEYVERANSAIAERQAAARDLIAAQERLMRESFGDLVASTAPTKPGSRRRSTSNGESSPDYAARIAKRKRTLEAKREVEAARAWATTEGQEIPESGAPSDEVMAAFRRATGYQG